MSRDAKDDLTPLPPPAGTMAARLLETGAHSAALPDLDVRPADEGAGYDKTGLWG